MGGLAIGEVQAHKLPLSPTPADKQSWTQDRQPLPLVITWSYRSKMTRGTAVKGRWKIISF